MEYREIIGFVKRRYRPAVVAFVVIMFAAIVFTCLIHPTYMSDCMLIMETGGQRQFLGEIALLRELTTSSKTGTPLDTQIELIRITPRLKQCIKELDLRDDKGEPLEQKDLLEKIRVQPYENTDIIQIRAYDYDPLLARDIAQALAVNHLKEEKDKNKKHAVDARQLMEDKVQSIKGDLDDVDSELRQFSERWGSIDVQTEAQAQVQAIAGLDKEYYSLRAELAGVRNRRKLLEEQLKEQEPVIISALTITRNPELGDLQRNLNGAEIRLAGLLTRYTEEHPDVITTREQIAGYRERMSELAERIVTSEVESPNPVYQQLVHEFAIAVTQEEGFVGQLNSVDKVRGNLREKALENIGEKELEYYSLKRRQKVLEQIYTSMQARLVEVLVKKEASDKEEMGRIVKNAEVPERPIAPNKLLNLISGFIIGIVIALILVLGLEFMDQRLRGPEEIVNTLGLKNLGTLDRGAGDVELNRVYGGIVSSLAVAGKGDRSACFLCIGRPQVGLVSLASLAGYASSAGPLTTVVLDRELSAELEGTSGKAGGGDLLAGLRKGVVKAASHPDGYNLIAAEEPYPVDLLVGEGFERFLSALGKKGRAFIFAPVLSNSPAAPMVCAACDGTVLLVEMRRANIQALEAIIEEIKTAGGNILGFINLA